MSKASRDKGAAGERELVEILRGHGWTRAHRNHQSGGQGGGDIARGPEGVHIECKRAERLDIPGWWRQAEAECGDDIPVVVFRRSREPWKAVVELDELLALLRMREAG